MADLSRDQLQRLARLGAQARLEELRREEAAIRDAFPDLFRARRGRPAKHAAPAAGEAGEPARRGRRRRSGMSPAARKAQSERMKRYWAERRKAKQSKSAK